MNAASSSAAMSAPREPGIDGAAAVYLDALRAGAANWVVFAHLLLLFHERWLPYQSGGVAVVVFFLLSGFLISQSMMKRLQFTGPQFPGFLADRVARITTPYVPALLIIALLNALFIETRFGGTGLVRGPLAFIGNLLMLEDHALFQLAEMATGDAPWRIRPYNATEPFWTVAIEMWVYVATGLVFFVSFASERLRGRWFWPLLLLSLPVLVWNAAAGGGRSLSLVWLLGALAGVVAPRLARLPRLSTRRKLSALLFACGAVALAGHVRKFGFNPYELQTASLIALVVFAPFVWLQTLGRAPRPVTMLCSAFASYSYSLYLIHNTVIAVVWSAVGGVASTRVLWLSVLLAHVAAIGIYLCFERHHRRVARWLRPRFEASMTPRTIPPSGTTAATAVH